MAGWRGGCGAAILVSVMALGGCEDAPAPAPVPAAVAARPAVPAGIVLAPQPDGGVGTTPGAMLVNDPSAPVDTPLCGSATREADAIGRSLLPRQYAEAGACSGFACYDPATATYLGLDGYRHVCR